MTRKDYMVSWLAMSVVLVSILAGWCFVRLFDMVMFSVSVGAIAGMLATIPIWLLARYAYREPVERIRPTTYRWQPGPDEYADFDDSDEVAISTRWWVVQ
ncbi:MAG: hypothetical protein AB7L09_24760 [Nitrospira sp.]